MRALPLVDGAFNFCWQSLRKETRERVYDFLALTSQLQFELCKLVVECFIKVIGDKYLWVDSIINVYLSAIFQYSKLNEMSSKIKRYLNVR